MDKIIFLVLWGLLFLWAVVTLIGALYRKKSRKSPEKIPKKSPTKTPIRCINIDVVYDNRIQFFDTLVAGGDLSIYRHNNRDNLPVPIIDDYDDFYYIKKPDGTFYPTSFRSEEKAFRVRNEELGLNSEQIEKDRMNIDILPSADCNFPEKCGGPGNFYHYRWRMGQKRNGTIIPLVYYMRYNYWAVIAFPDGTFHDKLFDDGNLWTEKVWQAYKTRNEIVQIKSRKGICPCCFKKMDRCDEIYGCYDCSLVFKWVNGKIQLVSICYAEFRDRYRNWIEKQELLKIQNDREGLLVLINEYRQEIAQYRNLAEMDNDFQCFVATKGQEKYKKKHHSAMAIGDVGQTITELRELAESTRHQLQIARDADREIMRALHS